MILIYIASPYTKGDNFVNVQRQIKAGNLILDAGMIPISPLLNSVYYHAQKERPWSVWMENDLRLLGKCDAILRLDGESKGADIEIDFAIDKNIPVYFANDNNIKDIISEIKDKFL